MDSILTIHFLTANNETGYVVLNLDEFLPCNQKQWKRMWRLLKQYDPYGELRKQLHDYITQQMETVKDENAKACRTRIDVGTSISELKSQIESGQYPNGLPIHADAMKERKSYLKEQKRSMQKLNQKVKETYSKYQRLSRHLNDMKKEGFH